MVYIYPTVKQKASTTGPLPGNKTGKTWEYINGITKDVKNAISDLYITYLEAQLNADREAELAAVQAMETIMIEKAASVSEGFGVVRFGLTNNASRVAASSSGLRDVDVFGRAEIMAAQLDYCHQSNTTRYSSTVKLITNYSTLAMGNFNKKGLPAHVFGAGFSNSE